MGRRDRVHRRLRHVRRSGSPLTTVPTWLITRTLGITAYLLLFFGICLGLLYGMPIWKDKQNTRLWIKNIHFLANTSGVFLAAIHPMLLVIDPYLPFRWTELIVPFTAPHEPFLYGLGTLTLYGLLFIIITTDLKKSCRPVPGELSTSQPTFSSFLPWPTA
ncbi:hypothetical protein EWH99_09635 [Sporolactobacillus sp. THM7-7]|nr:hypothetical protein EWH99_09635 [Sporolactobacillus sp. THM7-7]